jgi:WD40 repeat protein
MPVRLVRLVLVGAAVLVVALASAAQPQPKPPYPADDPLPDGAKLRFGTTRPILRGSPHVGLIGPKFNDFLVPTSTGGIRRYNLGTGRPLDKGQVVSGQVVVSADGKRAAVARPGNLAVVDVGTGKQLFAVKPPDGVVIVGTPGVSLSAKGDVLAYGGKGKDGKGEVVVWSVEKNEALARIETAQAAPVVPLLSPDATTLVTHGPPLAAPTLRPEPGTPAVPEPKVQVDPDMLRTAQVWEVATGNELFKARVTGMGGMVVTAAYSGDGSFVALSAGDGPVDLFDVKTGKRIQTLLGRKGQGVKLAVAPDGKTIAAIAPDYRIQRWSAEGKSLGVTEPPPVMLVAQISGLQFVDNERVVGWQTQAQFAVAWEAPTGRLLSPLTDHIAALRSISGPIEGKDLFTSGADGRVFRWDYATGAPNEAIRLHPARLPGQPMLNPIVTISADATRAVGSRTPLEVFDMIDGHDLFIVPSPSAPPAANSHFVSPDGMKVINVCRPADGKRAGACVVWDLATEQRVLELEIPPSTVIPSASMNADGSRLVILTHTRDAATGQAALVVTGWDVKTGKKLGEATDPNGTDTVYVTAIGDSSAVLASRPGRLWSVDYAAGTVGKDIDKLPTRGEVAVYVPVVFSPDGKRFACCAPGDKTETYGVRVYDWPTGKRARTYIGHAAAVSAMRFTADGKYLATGSQDTSVLLWDLTKNPDGK